MQLRFLRLFVVAFFVTLVTYDAWAQNSGGDQLDLEQALSVENQEKPQKEEEPEKAQAEFGPETVDPKELSDLARLAPFSDIAVIQKRFLPKTQRFELFPSFGLILNDVFFFNSVISGRLAYHFTEKYGLEAQYLALGTSDRQVVRDIRDRNVTTENLVTPKGYFGLDFKWTPIYGKMGFLSQSVIPFDMYFTAGGGLTQTNQSTSPFTFHAGTGQIFAINKWMGLRWDVSAYWYNSTTKVGGRSGGSFMNLHLTLGASFYFPEAKYR